MAFTVSTMGKENYYKVFVYLHLLFILAILGYYLSTYGASTYVLGELLINYECGLTRRGLLGTLLFTVSDILGVSVILTGHIILAVTYLFVYSFIVYRLRSQLSVLLLVVVAPFGFLFIVNVLGAYGYKDIFVLLFYLLILQIIQAKPAGIIFKLLVYLLIFIVAFIHEGFLFFSVPFLVLFSLGGKANSDKTFTVKKFIRSNKASLGIILFSFSTAVIIFLITNTDKSLLVNCLSNQYRGIVEEMKPDSLPGVENFYYPVVWLNVDLMKSIKLVNEANFNVAHLIQTFLFIGLLAISIWLLLVQYYPVRRILSFVKENILFLIYGMLSIAFVFVAALDWGRWLYLIFMHIVIYLCFKKPRPVKEKRDFSSAYNYLFFSVYLVCIVVEIPHNYSGYLTTANKTVFIQLLDTIMRQVN